MRTRAAMPRGFTEFAAQTKRNLPLLLLGGLFVAGAFCGSGLYRTMSAETADTLMFLLSGTGSEAQEFQFLTEWGAVLVTNLCVVLILFLCGFCAISQPLIACMPFIKGLGFGLVAAYNSVLLTPYSQFFWLKFLPGAFLATALILLCARQSLELSTYVYQSVFGEKPKLRRSLPMEYGAKYVAFALLCAVFSLIDVLFDLVYEVLSRS